MTNDMMNLRDLVAQTPDADLLREMIGFVAGIIRCGRQGHQRTLIPHQAVADSLGISANTVTLSRQALLFQSGVQRIKAGEPRCGNQKVPSPIAAFRRCCASPVGQWITPSTLPLSLPLPDRPNLSQNR